MKGMNMLCSSPASTAITSSTVVRRSSKRHASVRRKSGQLRVPCNSSQFPINPSPYHRKSLADKQNNDLRRKTTVEVDNLYGSSSTRYLLSDTVDTPFIQWVSDSHKISAMPIQDQVFWFDTIFVFLKRNLKFFFLNKNSKQLQLPIFSCFGKL